jgi:hypothetical protein
MLVFEIQSESERGKGKQLRVTGKSSEREGISVISYSIPHFSVGPWLYRTHSSGLRWQLGLAADATDLMK